MARGFEKTQAVLAKNVRELREAKGLSQEMLALESEVDRTYVSQIERGACNPSLRVLHQIASVLKVPMADLHRVSERSK
jgi:transcriptional regulator with XRE-family HTH domain